MAAPHDEDHGPRAWAQSALAMGLAVLVALTIRCFFCEIFQIPTGSMIPTLQVGDRILVNKLVYGPRIPFTGRRLWSLGAPKRGEVAVFIAPLRGEDYIKRIVGLPGDTLEVRAGRVYINDRLLPRDPLGPVVLDDRDEGTGIWHPLAAEAHLERFGSLAPERDVDLGGGFVILEDRAQRPGAHDTWPTRVPEGHVFVMGDNRDHSSDSREWGMVPMGSLLGRATVVLFSWGERGPSVARSGRSVHQPARLPKRLTAPL